MPRRTAKGKELCAFREDLDLARWTEHRADVPVLECGAGMRLIAFGAGNLQGLTGGHLASPPLDVDDVEQPAITVGEKHRPHAVREAVEAFEGCERLRVGRRGIRHRHVGTAGIARRAQQEDPG
jgi:hypothetical protein